MMRHYGEIPMIKTITLALLAALVALPAAAWGPKTQLAISTTAMHLISKESNIPLNKMADSVRRGSSESQAALLKMYPDMLSGPIQAIEAEMLLLKSVRTDKLDNYYAYRLGLLGKLVAQTTAPMKDADATYRNLYYTDVERAIESTQVANRPRETVDPALYFGRRVAEANANNDVIEKEYEAGVGISGVAGSLLAEDTSRSARAVADVWLTILMDPTPGVNMSDERLREYSLAAMEFYAGRKNAAALDAAEDRYAKLAEPTSAYLVELGDTYFEAGFNERAIEKYKDALVMDPSRRDVVGRISDYYVARGDAELENEQLESALESYKAAVDANPLHDSAEGNRLQAAKLIRERDTRMGTNQGLVERADQLASMAEQEALKGRSAEAIDLLREAEVVYLEVTDEFPLEAKLRDRGVNQVRHRMQELKQKIMANASDFSGTGHVQDVRELVDDYGSGMDAAGLQAILKRSYDEEYVALSRELEEAMSVR